MRWFSRLSDPDTALAQLEESLSRCTALARELAERQDGLTLALKQLTDDSARELRAIVKEHQEDYGRLHSAIESVRHSVAGRQGGRPSKGDPDLQEMGRRFVEACATPAGALALAADLQKQAAAAGAQEVNIFGEPKRNGRAL
jgi:hypothetical protein